MKRFGSWEVLIWNLIAKERGLGAFLGETEIGSWVEEIGSAV